MKALIYRSDEAKSELHWKGYSFTGIYAEEFWRIVLFLMNQQEGVLLTNKAKVNQKVLDDFDFSETIRISREDGFLLKSMKEKREVRFEDAFYSKETLSLLGYPPYIVPTKELQEIEDKTYFYFHGLCFYIKSKDVENTLDWLNLNYSIPKRMCWKSYYIKDNIQYKFSEGIVD